MKSTKPMLLVVALPMISGLAGCSTSSPGIDRAVNRRLPPRDQGARRAGRARGADAA